MTQEKWPKPDTDIHASLADKKGGMIGKKMGEIYDNYFENQAVLEYFNFALDDVNTQIKTNDIILEIGANAGIVGESVKKHFLEQNIEIHLIISDINIEAINDNQQPDTLRMVFDNKDMPIKDNFVKLVLARSVIHYEATPEKEIKVLEEVKRILEKDGIFINQTPTASTKEEAELWNNIHFLVNKPMNTQTKENITEILRKVFDNVDLAKKQPPPLSANEAGFIKRYNINESDTPQIIKKIQNLINATEKDKRPNIRTTGSGFEWDVPFTIFICKK